MLGTTWLVRVAGNIDGGVIGGWLALNESLRIEGPSTTTAISHALGDAAPIGIHKPGEVQHFSERDGAKIQVEAGDENIVIRIEQVPGEDEKTVDKLTLIDRDALDSLAGGELATDCADRLERAAHTSSGSGTPAARRRRPNAPVSR